MTDELMQRINGVAKNPNDPLLKAAPERVRHLINAYGDISDGFSAEDVVKASISLAINVMRQVHPTRQQAEARFNEVFGQAKQILMNHYDGTGKRRQGIFPYDQTLSMPRVDPLAKKYGQKP